MDLSCAATTENDELYIDANHVCVLSNRSRAPSLPLLIKDSDGSPELSAKEDQLLLTIDDEDMDNDDISPSSRRRHRQA
jgi:hypothetical protein